MTSAISVVVPSYRRPADLERCLEALEIQLRLANEVLVVVRDSDEETHALLAQWQKRPARLPLRVVTVKVGGAVAAYNVGLDAASGDIIAITDDDSRPRPDWLQRIEAHFAADKRVGGVGGRDWVYVPSGRLNGSAAKVGKVSWFGRVVGNHHLGVGPPRTVDVLKGVNMSFRRSALHGVRCDSRMRGGGAQVHFELALCLQLRRAGWKLIFDPSVAVDHYPAQRFDEDQRNSVRFLAIKNSAHNETLALWEHLPPVRRAAFLGYAVLMGTRIEPGLLQLPRLLLRREPSILRRFEAVMAGRVEGIRSARQSRRKSSGC